MSAVKAWPLMEYSEFLPFCEQAIKLCEAADTDTARSSVEAFQALRSLAIRQFRHMQLVETLGAGQRRFKVHMFTHLQFMTVKRVLFTNPSAMPTFVQATDLFLARIPASSFSSASAKAKSASASSARSTSARKSPRKQNAGPKVTCYLCVTPGHYCNNVKFHKRNEDNLYPAVTEAMRKKILARVDGSDLSSGEKELLKGTIRQFWRDRCVQNAS